MTTITLNNNNTQELNDNVFAQLDAIIENVELNKENTQELNDNVFASLDAIIEEEETTINGFLQDDVIYIDNTECKVAKITEKAILVTWSGFQLWIPKSVLLPVAVDALDVVEFSLKTWFLISCESKNINTPCYCIELHRDNQNLIVETAILNAKKAIEQSRSWSKKTTELNKKIVKFYA
jgi:hypothetical protein